MQFGAARPPTGHGTLRVKLDAGAATTDITVEEFGADTVLAVRHAKRELVERSRAEAVFLDLPLNDPATPNVAESLEYEGFALAGVVPHLTQRGDIGRFIYLVEPLCASRSRHWKASRASWSTMCWPNSTACRTRDTATR